VKRMVLALLCAFAAVSASVAEPLREHGPVLSCTVTDPEGRPAAAYDGGDTGSLPLRLRVVDETGQPVTGARVQAGNAGEDGSLDQAWPEVDEEVVRTAETSPEGVVRLTGLPLSRALWVLIEKEGFIPELRSVMLSRRVTCPEIDITLRRGEIAEGRKLDRRLLEESYPNVPELLRDRVDWEDAAFVFSQTSKTPARPKTRSPAEAVVTGWVMEPDGAPLPGALLYASWDGGFAEAVAADDGFFQLEAIPEGRVHVIARAVGFHGKAETLEITGDHAAVDFTLIPGEEAITLRGRVMTADGEPLEGAAVWISNLLVHSDRAGWFTLVVPSHWTGWAEIQAGKDGFARGQTSFLVQGKCMTGIEIRLAEKVRTADFTPSPHGQR
jgi:protocatechuate 3,4-dioxygenase beta subunit